MNALVSQKKMWHSRYADAFSSSVFLRDLCGYGLIRAGSCAFVAKWFWSAIISGNQR